MSSLKDLASLIMIPSLYEDGELHTVKPLADENIIVHPDATDNNDGVDGSTPSTSSNFTFSRGSNLAATRVDVNGLIEKGRENLALYSQDYTNAYWLKSNLTLSANSIANPINGATTATTLTPTATNGIHYIRSTPFGMSANTIISQSIYAKANGYNYIMLEGYDGAHNPKIMFNLSDGSFSTIGASGSPIGSVEALANGWYRLKMTWQTQSGSPSVRQYYFVYENNNTNSYAGNGTSGAYLFGAQMELGLVATDYIETGATTAQSGILEDLPRLDYSGGASCPSLLLEPQRSNLITQSEYFGGWTNDTNTSLTPNAIQSPSGFVDAYKMSAGTSNARQGRTLNVSVSGSLALSVYAKKGEYSVVQLTDAVDASLYANFDLENGVLGNYNLCTPSIEDAGNGWYRCIITWTASVNINKVRVSIAESKTQGRLVDFVGNGTDGLYIFGAQLEAGSYPTSYIPTNGSAVTRSKDLCVSSSLTTSTDFTIFFEAKDFCLINGGTTTGYADIQFVFGAAQSPYDVGGSYHIYANSLYYYNGSATTNFGVIFNNQTDSKFALVKRGNKGVIFANGVKKTEITLPSGADAKVINWDTINLTQSLQDAQGDVFGSNYKQLLKFDTALTDSECIALTS